MISLSSTQINEDNVLFLQCIEKKSLAELKAIPLNYITVQSYQQAMLRSIEKENNETISYLLECHDYRGDDNDYIKSSITFSDTSINVFLLLIDKLNISTKQLSQAQYITQAIEYINNDIIHCLLDLGVETGHLTADHFINYYGDLIYEEGLSIDVMNRFCTLGYCQQKEKESRYQNINALFLRLGENSSSECKFKLATWCINYFNEDIQAAKQAGINLIPITPGDALYYYERHKEVADAYYRHANGELIDMLLKYGHLPNNKDYMSTLFTYLNITPSDFILQYPYPLSEEQRTLILSSTQPLLQQA